MNPLQKARKDRGWTIYKAAQVIGIGPAMLENLERHQKSRPRARVVTIERICWAFPEITLAFFLPQSRFVLEPRTDAGAIEWESNRL